MSIPEPNSDPPPPESGVRQCHGDSPKKDDDRPPGRPGTDSAEVAKLVEQLGLRPHPEGGHYRETYRSPERVLRASSASGRGATAQPAGESPGGKVLRQGRRGLHGTAVLEDGQSPDDGAGLSPADTGGLHSASTAIYYLLDKGAYSAWHRIASDEVWHFYAGGPLRVHVLLKGGVKTSHRLGNPLSTPGCAFQAVVPAGSWFAAELEQADSFALVGCTVAPGFEFEEFELATKRDLEPWLHHGAVISRLLKNAVS